MEAIIKPFVNQNKKHFEFNSRSYIFYYLQIPFRQFLLSLFFFLQCFESSAVITFAEASTFKLLIVKYGPQFGNAEAFLINLPRKNLMNTFRWKKKYNESTF